MTVQIPSLYNLSLSLSPHPPPSASPSTFPLSRLSLTWWIVTMLYHASYEWAQNVDFSSGLCVYSSIIISKTFRLLIIYSVVSVTSGQTHRQKYSNPPQPYPALKTRFRQSRASPGPAGLESTRQHMKRTLWAAIDEILISWCLEFTCWLVYVYRLLHHSCLTLYIM